MERPAGIFEGQPIKKVELPAGIFEGQPIKKMELPAGIFEGQLTSKVELPAGVFEGQPIKKEKLPAGILAKAEHAVEAKHAAKQYKVEAQRKAELVPPLFGGEAAAAAAAVVVIGMFEGKPAGEFLYGSNIKPSAGGSTNANSRSVFDWKQP